MALAAVLRITIQQNGGGGGGATVFSWISKGVAIGVNKHGLWILAAFLLLRGKLC